MIAQADPREGVSLLEVILSVSILVGAIAALGGLIDASSKRARLIEERSLAMQLCQSKMAEVSAGIVSLEGQAQGSFEDTEADPDWEYSIDVEPAEFEGLYTVTVIVNNRRSPGREYSLRQIVLDPQMRGTTLDEAKIAGSDEEGTEEPAQP